MDPSAQDANFLSNKQDFAYFLSPDNGDNIYESKVEDMINKKDNRLIVNLRDINEYDPNLRRNILSSPMEYIPCWEEALKDYINHNQFGGVGKQQAMMNEYKIGLKGSFGGHRVTPQRLMSNSIATMVCCEGIVTKVSLIRPKVKETVHFCEATQQFTSQKYRDSTALMGQQTGSTYPTTDSQGNNLTTEFGLCTFQDHQRIYIQDMPERTEPGSMPQTVECILDGDLVDCCKPGDRVQVIGIYRALAGKRAVGQTSGKFHTVILVNNVVKIGIGSKKESESSLSAKEIKSIKKYSKKKDIFGLLGQSLIPSIHGHDYIKKAIVLQLLGGIAKDLDNGTHLRGDINLLMIGDPSCGKSQLLRGVMNIGKLVINTTGRGSSGVGLTAAVTLDKDSGEKKLEAGAMVLADGGIVCIDEFDKMTDQDRTAIHEVMEQQTVTIAKAGIHTSLNARCSVIAAANPVYGMYDRHKKPYENIGLPDSLLSRFDLLFIVLDKIDTKIDRNISDHVLKMHLTPYNPNEDDTQLDYDNEEEDDEDQDVSVWSKQRLKKGKQKIFTPAFVKKYIDFAKKQYKPTLTDEACEEIANKYAELREEERNQTLPITARCLETIIRLSTAHAKLRLSKKVSLVDVEQAVELLNFALTNDAEPEQKQKRKKHDGDDEDDDEDMGGDGGDDDDVQMGDEEQSDSKMMELGDDDEEDKNKNKRRSRKRKNAESPSGTKRVKRSESDNAGNSEIAKHVTTKISHYFRVNRTGQVTKQQLLAKINEDGDGEMTQEELDTILSSLHSQNKIFYLDPMVHQL